MITEADTRELKKTFVSKEEHEDAFTHIVQHMATKEDIADIHEELSGIHVEISKIHSTMSTKGDIAEIYATMATKADIAEIYAVMATKKDIQRLDEKIDTKFDRVMVTLDRVAGVMDEMRLEMAASAVQYSRQLAWNQKVGQKVGIPFDY